MPRYRFGEFVVSPRRRVLLRSGREQPLIPRYFDLLIFLIERRHEAVHRRDIFERVWSDVVVSDSALSQAVRTIRRILGDDSRDPIYIRTVSRHGYRFVYQDLVEEEDDQVAPAPEQEPSAPSQPEPAVDAFEPLLDAIARPAATPEEEEARREAAELLHALGTGAALRRLGQRPGHARARALLRDTRWESAGAGTVPILGTTAPLSTAAALVTLRLRRAGRIVAARWAGASIGAGLAGAFAGGVGGLLLAALPGSRAHAAVAVVLAAVGLSCGAAGGAGVAAGLSAAEAVARSRRGTAVVFGAAAGGGLVGLAAQSIARWSLAALVGLHLDIGGAWEGLALGAATGLGYVAGSWGVHEGLAAPRGRGRVRLALATGAACGVAALGLSLAGRPLVGGTIHAVAQASTGSEADLSPLGRLIGEPGFGPVTRAAIATLEGALFGFGFSAGITRISPHAH